MNTFTPKFTITHRMTQAITRIERARGFLEAAQLSGDWIREVGEQALLRESHRTCPSQIFKIGSDGNI